MSERSEQQFREGFAAENRYVMSRRTPLGVSFYLALVGGAGLLEYINYPERATPLLLTFSIEVLLGLFAILAARTQRLLPYAIPLALGTTSTIGFLITGYVVTTNGSGDALAFALILFMTGVALLLPWGLQGQVPLALGTLGAYLAALAFGVRGELPMLYGVVSMIGGVTTSTLGAGYLEQHRRAIFRQRLLLERTRDQQIAMLYDVTRTVTATLELQQVLWLVCQSVLHALKVERLWLFWREAPEGELRSLRAERRDGQVAVAELPGDPAPWEAVLQGTSEFGPDILEADAPEVEMLAEDEPRRRLLRLPLVFQSELVGVILADRGPEPLPLETSFLDFAATLGNSAAMAIANARLHALVLHHRAELQELTNKRVDVVEEGLRRLSRELHDGTCQALMAIKLDLALLERQLPPELWNMHSAIQDIRGQVVDVVQGVRQMSHLIRPPVLDDFGAVAAIESVAEKYRATSELDVRVESPEPALRFIPPVEVLLFRVFQEALINTVKHAGATRVHVRLTLEDGAAVLEIDDNGQGFDAHAYFRTPPKSAGLGLIGMRERIAHFNGVFRVTSRRGVGTRIFVSVPVDTVTSAAPIAAAL